MLAFSEGVNAAVISSAKATSAASNLPGTTPRQNAAGYKTVEEQSALVEAAGAKALAALEPLVDVQFSDPTVQAATEAVTIEGRSQLQEAEQFSRLALRFERGLNSQIIAERKRRIGSALRSLGSSSITSTTTGSVNGVPFQATTTTTTPKIPPPVVIKPDATVDETAVSLSDEETRLVLLPYTFNPLVRRWTTACKNANLMLDAAPTSGL
jgi:hypothetical protein